MTRSYVTPLVAKLASKFEVDLAQVAGSGVGGRVTADDVRKAAGQPSAEEQRLSFVTGIARALRPAPAAVTPSSSSNEATRSEWDTGVSVRVDPYHRNYLVEDARQSIEATYNAALREAPAPTMFVNGGDLPIFLASGADPTVLLRVPWQARHYAANADSPTLAYLLEHLAGDGILLAGEFGSEGLTEYRGRVRSWLMGDPLHRAARVGEHT